MSQEIDSGKNILPGKKLVLNLEKIILKTNSPIQISLANWKKKGLMIDIKIEGFGYGHFNNEPYLNVKTALANYFYVLNEIKKGNYSIEIYGNNKLKFFLK